MCVITAKQFCTACGVVLEQLRQVESCDRHIEQVELKPQIFCLPGEGSGAPGSGWLDTCKEASYSVQLVNTCDHCVNIARRQWIANNHQEAMRLQAARSAAENDAKIAKMKKQNTGGGFKSLFKPNKTPDRSRASTNASVPQTLSESPSHSSGRSPLASTQASRQASQQASRRPSSSRHRDRY